MGLDCQVCGASVNVSNGYRQFVEAQTAIQNDKVDSAVHDLEERPEVPWRTVAGHDAKRYYFESTIRSSVFWVDRGTVDLKPGADVMKLDTLGSKNLAGEVSSEFKPAESFVFMTTWRASQDR